MRLTATGLYNLVEIFHLQFTDELAHPKKIEARYAKTLTTLNGLIDEKKDSSRIYVLRYGKRTRLCHFPLLVSISICLLYSSHNLGSDLQHQPVGQVYELSFFFAGIGS
ncbi:hypothetical protein PHYBLDRAFT_143605 [Phycomyces blakesleeanus NRRL 1555(-)]|uniref:Uncharacterized protein n=1 Tax=Phycomyces blakesleeanus (strain ATCC 8743b / DSM 1359 / FGSC 10004 / NBRC 33097 / NRRL 1555) TaxID=763407 RepID=A0A167N8S2_PHYB8|nr:hypothetical protein PHYBLDRAFT_143605 [Phycomyces blakesleeanus NRRL 1555(-)]OAD75349.1 hypothetical protein PHYBLDRAFT_143605 [Phycomyces blakesleeanus NRRL 1555(-)]|eukprot:XP_018293389.1 hypothetical protein PHYBLDRAFT_143605 [Phycomyces blakesleeanus NRRL 1555(-)]